MYTHCVIGSGPAGVACVKALLARGASVLMLDAGLELEPDRAQTIRRLAKTKSVVWTPADRAALKGEMTADAKGISVKLAFGSDFPYRETREKIPWQGHGVSLYPSLALGGFSNVWGATMLPYRDVDLADWPIKNAQLEQHYRAVLAFTGLAAQRDELEELFTLHGENPGVLPASEQARRLLDRLARHGGELHARGWRFGRARLAIRAADTAQGPGCLLCGACMSGCPYGCIYNSADTVRDLLANNNFSYQRDVVVTTLREQADQVVIEGFNRRSGMPISFEAKRVFLAAGVISSAQIILRSEAAYDQPLRLCDSQYFIFPLVLARGVHGVQHEALYTLSQVFIELNRPAISRHAVHLQVYTYNDILGEAVRKSLGALKGFAPLLEQRLLVVQGYLHSDESQTMEMILKRDGAKDCLHVKTCENSGTRRVVKKVMHELLKQAWRLGGIVLPPMLQIGQPGHGFHSGGSLPMREKPGRFESDCLGRPHGWLRVHAVDASVLPSIPATTITFSVMANAHRIGWEAAALD